MKIPTILSLIALTVSFAPAGAKAESSGIQMMPPVTFDGTEKTPCSGAQAGLLQWDGTTSVKCIPSASGDANGNVSLGSSAPQLQDANSQPLGNVVAASNVLPYGRAVVGESCAPNGLLATTTTGALLSCISGQWQPQFRAQEEMGSIVGCSSDNNWCASLVSLHGQTGDAPPGTVLYNSCGGGAGCNAWNVTIGPRTFCATGMVAFGPSGNPGAQFESWRTFCRVLPNGTDQDTGLPIWHLHIGSQGGLSVGCHAVCVK